MVSVAAPVGVSMWLLRLLVAAIVQCHRLICSECCHCSMNIVQMLLRLFDAVCT